MCTSVTCREQSPTLQTESVRSAQQQALTPPKVVEPATASLPEGASPDTRTVCGEAGSLLATVITPVTGPKPAGAKRIGKASESPVPINNGNDRTSGARN